jgi:hypothetical protein
VVEAAEAEPEKFGDLPARMDAESVEAAHRELKARRSDGPKPQPYVRAMARLTAALDALRAVPAEPGEGSAELADLLESTARELLARAEALRRGGES